MSFERLEQIQKEKNILKYQLIAAKGIERLRGMAEMARTQRELEIAGVPLEHTKHGVIVPSTAKAQMSLLQQGILSGAQMQAKTIGAGYATAIVHEKNYTNRYEEELAKNLQQEREIAELYKELRNRPTQQTFNLSNPFDFKFPNLSDLKTPLIIAGAAIAGLFLIGKLISRGK